MIFVFLFSLEEDVYCLCQTPERPGMIGCDFCDEWFHPDCLNLSKNDVKKFLKCQWACPNCEPDDGEGIFLLLCFHYVMVSVLSNGSVNQTLIHINFRKC